MAPSLSTTDMPSALPGDDAAGSVFHTTVTLPCSSAEGVYSELIHASHSHLSELTDSSGDFSLKHQNVVEQQVVCSAETSAMNGLQTSPTPTTFHKFGRLPPEIRVKIWKMVAHQPRILHIMSFSRTASGFSDAAPSFLFDESARFSRTRLVCRAPVPSLLQTNSEARTEGLKFYKARFGLNNFEPRIYVNNFSDTILIPSHIAEGLHRSDIPDSNAGDGIREVFKNILHLGLILRFGRAAWEKNEDKFQRLLSVFPNITSILFIHDRLHTPSTVRELDPYVELDWVDQKDILRRYQQKVVVKAVEKVYGDKEHPTVETKVLRKL